MLQKNATATNQIPTYVTPTRFDLTSRILLALKKIPIIHEYIYITKRVLRSRLLGHDDVERLVDGGGAVGLDVQVGGLTDALRRRGVRVDGPRQLAHRNIVLVGDKKNQAVAVSTSLYIIAGRVSWLPPVMT